MTQQTDLNGSERLGRLTPRQEQALPHFAAGVAIALKAAIGQAIGQAVDMIATLAADAASEAVKLAAARPIIERALKTRELEDLAGRLKEVEKAMHGEGDGMKRLARRLERVEAEHGLQQRYVRVIIPPDPIPVQHRDGLPSRVR